MTTSFEKYELLARKLVSYYTFKHPRIGKMILRDPDQMFNIACMMMRADLNFDIKKCYDYETEEYARYRYMRCYGINAIKNAAREVRRNLRFISLQEMKFEPVAPVTPQESDETSVKAVACLLENSGLTEYQHKSIREYYLDNKTMNEIGKEASPPTTRQTIQYHIKNGMKKIRSIIRK